MGNNDSTQPVANPAIPAPALPYAHAPVAPGPINYFRFTPQEAGWTSVASFGTAAVWHQARDVLTQKHIVCRMVADPTNTRTEDQRMELLVMASEAEWACEVLRWGVPELVSTAFPPGGFPVVQGGVPMAARAAGGPPPLPEWFFRQHPFQSPPVQQLQPRRVLALAPGDPSAMAINYFRYLPPEAGWTTIASFGTAAVWHSARDLLSQHHIVCRMIADETAERNRVQRMELLVMAHETAWARELLKRGIPELAEMTSPSAPPPGPKAPLAALPVGPISPAETTGQSVAFTLILTLAILALIGVIISMIYVSSLPGF